MSLKGKVIFVTGASRGIGLAIALKAAKDGAKIAIAAKTATPNEKLPGTIYSAAEDVKAAGGEALALVVDVRDEEQVKAAIEKTVETFGGIDIVINNAGAIQLAGTEATTMKRFDLMHSVNARAVFMVTKHALPYLKGSAEAGRNPHVLSLSPPLNLNPGWLGPHLAYTLSKYGMSLCTLGLAEEFKELGIAVNSLWPETAIDTSAVRNLLGGDATVALSRKPEIVADAAYWIFNQPAATATGKFFIDAEVLKASGVTDFSVYSVDPNQTPMPDFFLGEPPQSLPAVAATVPAGDGKNTDGAAKSGDGAAKTGDNTTVVAAAQTVNTSDKGAPDTAGNLAANASDKDATATGQVATKPAADGGATTVATNATGDGAATATVTGDKGAGQGDKDKGKGTGDKVLITPPDATTVASPALPPSVPAYKSFALTLDANSIARLTLNRPTRANCLTTAFFEELPAALEFLATSKAKVLALTAEGKVFCAGLDLSVFNNPALMQVKTKQQRHKLRGIIRQMQDTFTALAQAPFPVIAAVDGLCLGAGLDLVSACDFLYATRNAEFSIEEINIGMMADLGTLQRLPGRMPEGLLRQLAFTGRRLKSNEAERVGFITQLFLDAEGLEEGLAQVTKEIASKAPAAVALTKLALNANQGRTVEQALDHAATLQANGIEPDVVKANVMRIMASLRTRQ